MQFNYSLNLFTYISLTSSRWAADDPECVESQNALIVDQCLR